LAGRGRPRLPVGKRLVAFELLAEGWSQRRAARGAGIGITSLVRLLAEARGMSSSPYIGPGSGAVLSLPARDPGTGFRLALREREEIRAGLERKESFRGIAHRLGRAPSTISREVELNGGRDLYRAVGAEVRSAQAAQRPKPRWHEQHPDRWEEVMRLLRWRWSPQQISRRFKTDHPDSPEMWVSAETIYQSIYVQGRGELRKELARCLRSGRAQRVVRQPGERARRGGIAGMVMISERPSEVEDRAVPGHWEGDLILGAEGKSAVATLVERNTRFGMLIKIDNKTAEHVRDRITASVTRLPQEMFRSLTWDQGTEMADHKRFTIETGIPVYFCDPHSP
jgi:IS30 family transposase